MKIKEFNKKIKTNTPEGKRLGQERNSEEQQKQPRNNEQTSNKYISINNYSKYKWTKCSNQKTEGSRMDKNMTHLHAAYKRPILD